MTDITSSDWTELDADNTNPSPNGVQGGYQPSTIAPIIRGIRGAIKRAHVRTNPYYTTTGTGNAYVLTYVGAPLAYTKGDPYEFFADRANTGAVTLNVNGLGAKALVMPDGSALTANQIKAGRVVSVIYNGTSFVMNGYVDQNLKLGDVSANTLTLTTALTIPEGGTGSTTAAAARTALGTDNANNITLGTLALSRGGTGANDAATARTNLGLVAVAASGSATDLTTGTLSDARLPTSMAGKTFISNTTIDHATTADLRFELAGVLSGRLYRDVGGGLVMRRYNETTGAAEGYIQITGNGVNDAKYNGNVMWHAGNDGAGSGLDADLLDGQSSAYYLSASNLNAGTVPNARISGAYSGITTLSTTGLLTVTNAGEALRVAGPAAADDPYITFYAGGVRQAYIQHTDGTGTGAGFRLFNDVTDDYLYLSNVGDVDALKFYDSSTTAHRTVWHSGNLTLADLGGASSSISITAGNGLSGGGTLAASRTVTLGTPGTLTSGTTNSVTSTSHTHEVDEDSIVSVGMAALGAGAVGTYMFAQRVGNTNGYAFGATIGGANLESASSSSGDGTVQSGTWRCMGNIGAGSTAGGSLSLFLRIS
ncbi:hypothetical protein FB009_117107 [Sinorhizobium medicae]|uniref:hypothetical protein n=1 Tax=Sinorhizobium medicae TaxID=110321 RepID=UPI00119A0A5F|nr:hypothetical protein [Sinorhizobium medicae]MQU78030.1 hypothetical protein [Sinorhizobium medicae]TWA34098.1 hypothetical protein FB009_117107 [Sinorhizobium medicae]